MICLLLECIPLDSGVGSCTSSLSWGPERGEVRLVFHMPLVLCRISEREIWQEGTLSSYVNVSTYSKPCEGMARLMANHLSPQCPWASHSLLGGDTVWEKMWGSVWNHCMSSLMLHRSWGSVWPRGSLPCVQACGQEGVLLEMEVSRVDNWVMP
jgi:hypothetical protein